MRAAALRIILILWLFHPCTHHAAQILKHNATSGKIISLDLLGSMCTFTLHRQLRSATPMPEVLVELIASFLTDDPSKIEPWEITKNPQIVHSTIKPDKGYITRYYNDGSTEEGTIVTRNGNAHSILFIVTYNHRGIIDAEMLLSEPIKHSSQKPKIRRCTHNYSTSRILQIYTAGPKELRNTWVLHHTVVGGYDLASRKYLVLSAHKEATPETTDEICMFTEVIELDKNFPKFKTIMHWAYSKVYDRGSHLLYIVPHTTTIYYVTEYEYGGKKNLDMYHKNLGHDQDLGQEDRKQIYINYHLPSYAALVECHSVTSWRHCIRYFVLDRKGGVWLSYPGNWLLIAHIPCEPFGLDAQMHFDAPHNTLIVTIGTESEHSVPTQYTMQPTISHDQYPLLATIVRTVGSAVLNFFSPMHIFIEMDDDLYQAIHDPQQVPFNQLNLIKAFARAHDCHIHWVRNGIYLLVTPMKQAKFFKDYASFYKIKVYDLLEIVSDLHHHLK